LRKNRCGAEASIIIKMPSAYSMTGKSGLGADIGNQRSPSYVALFKIDYKRSAANIERGSPCPTPLL